MNYCKNIEKFEEDKLLKYDSKIIHIWQGENDIYTNKLLFMYKPVNSSIKQFLEYSNNNIQIDYKSNYYNFDEINPNEILIWVGNIGIPDFESLNKRGIYTIYYNTEPDTEKFTSNEIWTYSKSLFDNYKKNNENQIIKFIPIIYEENIPSVDYNSINNHNIKLIFIGELSYRGDKKDIIFKSELLKNNIKEVNNLWNDDDYNNYIVNNPGIYLNLTKSGTNALPSVRINKLLSHKCIIISEHTNDIDEEYYKGIVYFCNINEIEDVYKKLINESNLHNISNEIYQKFYDKFYYKNAINLITEK